MKIDTKRSGISQSMDLFIIIAAVLGVGGVVTASVYGLIGASSSQSTLQLTQVSLVGTGTSTTGGTATLTLVLKNLGSSSITVPTSAYVTLATNNIVFTTTTSCNGPTAATPPVPAVSTSAGSVGGTWNANAQTVTGTDQACNAAGTGVQVRWTPTNSFTLAPGAQMAFAATIPVTASSGSVGNPNTTGSNYALTINVGTTTVSQQLTSQ